MLTAMIPRHNLPQQVYVRHVVPLDHEGQISLGHEARLEKGQRAIVASEAGLAFFTPGLADEAERVVPTWSFVLLEDALSVLLYAFFL